MILLQRVGNITELLQSPRAVPHTVLLRNHRSITKSLGNQKLLWQLLQSVIKLLQALSSITDLTPSTTELLQSVMI